MSMCTKSFWEKISRFLEHEKQYRLVKVERSPCDTWKPLLRKPLCFAQHIHQCILRAGEQGRKTMALLKSFQIQLIHT